MSAFARSRSRSIGVAALVAQLALLSSHIQSQTPSQYDRWMGNLFAAHDSAMDQSLARFIFPGSHDAGTYRLSEQPACEGCSGSDLITDLVANCEDIISDLFEDAFCSLLGESVAEVSLPWAEAQSVPIGAQLNAGARVLDLRFFRATVDDAPLEAGQFYVHHTLTGPTSGEIFNDIAAFVNDPNHAQEIVILRFGAMQEGDGSMQSDSLNVFFNTLYGQIGPYMAPTPEPPVCSTDPTNAVCSTATASSGDATTLRAFLDQGSRVIVACDCQTLVTDDTVRQFIWPSIAGTSPYDAASENGGYPTPDDADHPWISDRDIFNLLDGLSASRDAYSQDQMFSMGVQIGSDERARAVIRGVACNNAILDDYSYFGCDAVNDDWDAFENLREVAAYTNPKAWSALVGLRRDRVNIVMADHYNPRLTDEAIKLNEGAMRVRLNIGTVVKIQGFGETPDFYPKFFFGIDPNVPPTDPWILREHKNVKQENADEIYPDWSAWWAYRNNLPDTSRATFWVIDDDPAPNEDDVAVIDGTKDYRLVGLPIQTCMAGSCLDTTVAISGTAGDNRASAIYEVEMCAWSWLADNMPVAAAACDTPPPVLAPIGARTVDEGTLLTFTATATGLAPLTYSVTNCAAGYYPGNVAITFGGVFTWTPTEAQGPGTYCVRVVVTNGANLTDFEDVTITVAEVNTAPVLSVPASFSTQWGATPAALEATATDADIPANLLTYSMVSGPIWATVTAAGSITFGTPSAADIGVHTVTVRVTDDGTPGLGDEASFSITVLPRPTTITYTGRTAGQYSDRSTLSATLVDVGTGAPLAGQNVTFTFNGGAAGTSATDASGVASVLYTVTLGAAGPYTVTASFTGGGGYAGSGPASASFAVTKETAAIGPVAFPGALPVSQTSIQVTGYVDELVPEPNANDGALAGDIGRVTVEARLTGVATNQGYNGSCTTGPVVDVAGTSYDRQPFTCTFAAAPFVVDAYTLSVSIPTANAYYATAAAEDALVVWDPNAGFATGGGTFALGGDRVSFGFGYTISGHRLRSGFVAVRHMADGSVCRVKSSNQLNPAAVNGRTATLSGKGNYTCSDAAGNVIPGQSQGNIDIWAYVEDNGTSGIGADKFWVSNTAAVTPNYLQMPSTNGAAANAVLLTGGNVQVPQQQGSR